MDHAAHPNHPVAPVLSLSSTYRGPHPDSAIVQKIKQEGFEAFDFENPEVHIYSRYTDETRLRTEQVLGKLCVSAECAELGEGELELIAAPLGLCERRTVML